jgi:energy-coupling factor transporter ATP-binding protein EcfA2
MPTVKTQGATGQAASFNEQAANRNIVIGFPRRKPPHDPAECSACAGKQTTVNSHPMINKLTVESFKTLEKVEVELGAVNVFVGANGSGKSNLLEALGVLACAADGKVDDQVLLNRGVRPGVPELYKSAFHEKLPQHIYFAAHNDSSSYEVSLLNPLKATRPWCFKTERLMRGDEKVTSRSPRVKGNPNTERGLAALEALKLKKGDAARRLLEQLQGFVIFSPTTPVLRGTSPETKPRLPVGLQGGRLPEAVDELLRSGKGNPQAKKASSEALSLIDWARQYDSAAAVDTPLSAAAGASPRVIRFVDRYMREGRNVLSGYDASEGALYILFLAVLAAHQDSPHLFAVDNADHGLNPRLAKALFKQFCGWILGSSEPRQVLVTTHNPQVLDGLPLRDDRVRLFIVARTDAGRTSIRRVEITEKLLEMAEKGWTLSRLWVMGHLGGVPTNV